MDRVMKKSLLLALALLLPAFAWGGQPVMGVSNIRWWDADYLTVTWGGDLTPSWLDKNSRDVRKYIVSILDSPTRADEKLFWRPSVEPVYVGSRVLAVDGRDARGWHTDRFYEAIESSYRHVIKLEHPAIGEYEVTLGTDFPAWMTAAGFHPAQAKWKPASYNTMSDRYKIRMDKDAPWRSFKTYDYYFSSDDVLADKELFETICTKLEKVGLTRDENNPDVVFTIVKDASQSVEYNYVPETEERVQTGSTSTPVYGWKGAYLGSVTTNKYTTVKSGGYTHKSATTTAYLEIDMLEAKKLGQKTLPLIYQLKYNYNENTESNVDKLYASAVTWFDWPSEEFAEEKTAEGCTRFFYEDIPLYDFGIILDIDGAVTGLDKNSEVVKQSGLKIGDVLKGLDVTQGKTLDNRHRTYYSGTITIERGGASKQLKFSKCSRTKFFKPISYATGNVTL